MLMYLEPIDSRELAFPVIASPFIEEKVLAVVSQMTIEEARASALAAWKKDYGRGSYFGIAFEKFGHQAIPGMVFTSFFISEVNVGKSSGGGGELLADLELFFPDWRGVDMFDCEFAGLELEDGIYYRPKSLTFACLDSLARTKWKIGLGGNELRPFEGLIAFQFTIDRKHDVAGAGGRSAKVFAEFLQKKKASEGVPWFIFVLASSDSKQYRWFEAVVDKMDKNLLDQVRVFRMILPLNHEPLRRARTYAKAKATEPVNLAEVESMATTVVEAEILLSSTERTD
jgi:hypothetical protein